MNFDKYLFRCSEVGHFICAPKPLTERQRETLQAYRAKEKLTEKQNTEWHSLESKAYEATQFKLTEGQKKLLAKVAAYATYGRRPDITTKYFTKGNEVEKKSRELLGEIMGVFLSQDSERLSNAYVTGKRDIKGDIIIDIKSSYTLDTFRNHLVESASDIYLYQLDSYMDLWDAKESILAYCLIDTPGQLIEDEIRRLNWKEPILNFEGQVLDDKIEVVKDLVLEHIYTREGLEKFCQSSANVYIEWFTDFIEIPKHERVHLVYHAFDPVRIEVRNESIRKCREYMNEIKPLNNLTI